MLSHGGGAPDFAEVSGAQFVLRAVMALLVEVMTESGERVVWSN